MYLNGYLYKPIIFENLFWPLICSKGQLTVYFCKTIFRYKNITLFLKCIDQILELFVLLGPIFLDSVQYCRDTMIFQRRYNRGEKLA
jgi:hypothetical protein